MKFLGFVSVAHAAEAREMMKGEEIIVEDNEADTDGVEEGKLEMDSKNILNGVVCLF